MQKTELTHLTTKMKHQRDEKGYSTILFLGAGVSHSAGIPLATEIMNEIEEDGTYKNYICYKNDEPSEKVCKLLLNKKTNGSRFIKGYNSDEFFRQIKIELAWMNQVL